MVTRSMLSSGGKGRPGATPILGMVLMNSLALRPVSIIMKLAWGSMYFTSRSRSQAQRSRRVLEIGSHAHLGHGADELPGVAAGVDHHEVGVGFDVLHLALAQPGAEIAARFGDRKPRPSWAWC